MKIAVTGAAGFIGSNLCERLLKDDSVEVIGIDAFVSTGTPRWISERNLEGLLQHPRFTFIEENLLLLDWSTILPKVDVVYHLAGIPGVRSSWGLDFQNYVTNNILGTQRLLEGCKQFPVQKLIYASTSSVYGETTGKVDEAAKPVPLSPYGVTKFTGEQLCQVYHLNDGLPIVTLRFFTVYGPRQRPDMAFHRFISHMLEGKKLPVNGSGLQTRDFTYVGDCVEAITAAAYAENVIGETINIGGKERASVLDCISMIEQLLNQKADLAFVGSTYGEPSQTWADISKAQKLLNYEPKVNLKSGLANEIADLRKLYSK